MRGTGSFDALGPSSTELELAARDAGDTGLVTAFAGAIGERADRSRGATGIHDLARGSNIDRSCEEDVDAAVALNGRLPIPTELAQRRALCTIHDSIIDRLE